MFPLILQHILVFQTCSWTFCRCKYYGAIWDSNSQFLLSIHSSPTKLIITVNLLFLKVSHHFKMKSKNLTSLEWQSWAYNLVWLMQHSIHRLYQTIQYLKSIKTFTHHLISFKRHEMSPLEAFQETASISFYLCGYRLFFYHILYIDPRWVYCLSHFS